MQREKILENKKVKPTAMRLLVLETFQAETEALSLQDLENKLYPADRVTLYRTVKTFVENDIIHTIPLPDGSVKYALCEHSEHKHHVHPHFTCSLCKKTHCMDEAVLTLEKIPEKYKITEVVVSLLGYCSDCKK